MHNDLFQLYPSHKKILIIQAFICMLTFHFVFSKYLQKSEVGDSQGTSEAILVFTRSEPVQCRLGTCTMMQRI